MGQISYTDLRQNLARYLDEAAKSRAPLLITRRNGKRAAPTKPAETVKGTFELKESIYTRLRTYSATTRKSGRTILTEVLNEYLAKHATKAA